MAFFEIKGEYIQLNQLLKALQWASSGGEAMHFIADGLVSVNGQQTTIKRKKIYADDTVQFEDNVVKIIRQK